jgi:hypothetical protein
MLAKRDGEFEVIRQFMKGDREAKSFLFDEMVALTTSLLSQLKIVLVSGTLEEKKAILKKIQLLRHIMQVHYEHIKAKANLSNEELNMIIEHFIATSPSYRNKISNAKQEMDALKHDLQKIVQPKKKIKSMKTKSKWIRS